MSFKTWLIIGLVVVVGGGAWWYFSPKSADDMTKLEATKPGSSVSTIPVTTKAISMQGFQYSPANVTVKVGTTITWTNKDPVAHTVTADNLNVINISSPDLAKGEAFTHTFNQVGTFTYHCTPHPAMTGTITVTQ